MSNTLTGFSSAGTTGIANPGHGGTLAAGAVVTPALYRKRPAPARMDASGTAATGALIARAALAATWQARASSFGLVFAAWTAKGTTSRPLMETRKYLPLNAVGAAAWQSSIRRKRPAPANMAGAGVATLSLVTRVPMRATLVGLGLGQAKGIGKIPMDAQTIATVTAVAKGIAYRPVGAAWEGVFGPSAALSMDALYRKITAEAQIESSASWQAEILLRRPLAPAPMVCGADTTAMVVSDADADPSPDRMFYPSWTAGVLEMPPRDTVLEIA